MRISLTRTKRNRFGHSEFEEESENDIKDFETSEDQIQLAAWIGVEVGPLDPAVAAHVSIGEGKGFMVYEVLDGCSTLC